MCSTWRSVDVDAPGGRSVYPIRFWLDSIHLQTSNSIAGDHAVVLVGTKFEVDSGRSTRACPRCSWSGWVVAVVERVGQPRQGRAADGHTTMLWFYPSSKWVAEGKDPMGDKFMLDLVKTMTPSRA